MSRRALDGAGRALDWGDVRDRNRIGRHGLLTCSVVLDRAGRPIATPSVTLRGLRAPAALLGRIAAEVRAELAAAGALGEEPRRAKIRAAVRRVLKPELAAVPEIEVHQHVVESG